MNTSNAVSANRNSAPFFVPAQPISGTVRTVTPINSYLSLRGRHSSSSTCIGIIGDEPFQFIKDGERVLSLHSREIIEEVIQRLASCKILKQSIYRNSGPGKDRSSAKDI